MESHPQHLTSSSVPHATYLRGTTTERKENRYDKVFDGAMKRLQSSSDVSDDDKVSIIELVEHLLAKNVSKQRTVKYINHLIVSTRMASKPLGQLSRKDMETPISHINTADYTDHTKHDYKIIIKKYFQ